MANPRRAAKRTATLLLPMEGSSSLATLSHERLAFGVKGQSNESTTVHSDEKWVAL